jgi:hypothetical protein
MLGDGVAHRRDDHVLRLARALAPRAVTADAGDGALLASLLAAHAVTEHDRKEVARIFWQTAELFRRVWDSYASVRVAKTVRG